MSKTISSKSEMIPVIRRAHYRGEFQKTCPNGGKICYSTRKKALKAVNKSQSDALKGKGLRPCKEVYECPYCSYWHITKGLKK